MIHYCLQYQVEIIGMCHGLYQFLKGDSSYLNSCIPCNFSFATLNIKHAKASPNLSLFIVANHAERLNWTVIKHVEFFIVSCTIFISFLENPKSFVGAYNFSLFTMS